MGPSRAVLVHIGGRDSHGCVPLRLVSAGRKGWCYWGESAFRLWLASLDSVKDAFTFAQRVQVSMDAGQLPEVLRAGESACVQDCV